MKTTRLTNAMLQLEQLERQARALEVSAERAFKEAGAAIARIHDHRVEIDRIRQEMASYAEH
jgi:hypothetical protein